MNAPLTNFTPNHSKTDKSIETVAVNNLDFLRAIFGDNQNNEYPILVSFKGNPAHISKSRWYGYPWTDNPSVTLNPDANNYFSLARFKPVEDLIQKLGERAKLGDPWAMKLCLDRLIPPLKPDDSICFDLPKCALESPDIMLKIVEKVTQAVASGQLSISDAERFSDFLGNQKRVIKDAEWKKKWG